VVKGEAGRLSASPSSLTTTVLHEAKVCLARITGGRENGEALQRCTLVTYQRAAVSQSELQLVSGARDGARGCRDSTTCRILGQHFFARAEIA
jgi:hypothetical protein